ncbi:UNVERIFIED_CONTAM: hypothetical protein Sindi_3097900 [Sesamum indicum]
MSDSLVRVSRRVEWGARWPAPGARSCRGTPWARAVRHDRGDGVPRAYRLPGLWPPPQSALVRAPSRSADRLSPFHIRPGRIAGPHPLPSRQFQALFDSLFKVLFIFPSRYLFAIGLSPVFSLGRNLPPDWGCIPKQPDSPTAPRGAAGSGHDGALTLSGAPFQGTWARSAAEDASPDYNSDSEAARFSSWAVPGSLAVTRGILRRRGIAFGPTARGCAREANVRPPRDGRGATRCVTPRQTCPGLMVRAATCVQRLDGSRDSAIHTKYRISLTFFIDARAEISVARVVLTFEETSPPPVHPADGATVRRTLRSVFLGACRAGGSFSPHVERVRAPPAGRGPDGGVRPAPGPRFYLQRVRGLLLQVSTMILPQVHLRKPCYGLLLPLNDKVQWTSRDVAGSEPPTSALDPNTSPDHSIGRSDGRCVQRAGRSQRELMTRAY